MKISRVAIHESPRDAGGLLIVLQGLLRMLQLEKGPSNLPVDVHQAVRNTSVRRVGLGQPDTDLQSFAVFAERPFVLLAQPSLFDPARAPQGKHTAWAYCHVPNGSGFDMLSRIESQIERFAPGFRERVLKRSVMPPSEIESHNANLAGGDIAAGAVDVRQFFMRPTRSLYSTPVKGLYICSASTPPGPGVHGMCGYFAAERALREALPTAIEYPPGKTAQR